MPGCPQVSTIVSGAFSAYCYLMFVVCGVYLDLNGAYVTMDEAEE